MRTVPLESAANLLVELFVEELPPKALQSLGDVFAEHLHASLLEQNLIEGQGAVAATAATAPVTANAGAGTVPRPMTSVRTASTPTTHPGDPAPASCTAFASPRRLAVHIAAVLSVAPDARRTIKLMPVSVGLSADGQPTPALLKKLASVGADAAAIPQLTRKMDGKAEALFFDSIVPGATLAEGLQKALLETLAKLPIPKVMQYQLADGWTSVHFVRPAHGLVALHGTEVVPVHALGLEAGRTTHGHRFEASHPSIELIDADHYAAQLHEEGAVIASFAERRAEIERQLREAGAALKLTPIGDAALLDEVTALVERPNVLACRFEAEFLAVPPECLILTMQANQKYFPLLDAAGALTHHFLVVSNIRPVDASRVIEGNERVVRPRLADAKFFFDQDRKKTLASRLGGLDQVVYHGKLGTQGERVLRVRAIARAIGRALGDEALAAQADRAAQLAKADLLTDMVGEFPELQGTMGRYYAQHDGLGDDIAFAIEDHYRPRFAGDALPRNEVALVVALADKLETLVGLFGIGQLPTGDRDPFALRRHALGVIRMLVERNIPVDLPWLVGSAVQVLADEEIQKQWSHQMSERQMAGASSESGGDTVAMTGYLKRQIDPKTAGLVLDFIHERLAGSLREQGYSAQEVDAVLSLRPARLAEVGARLDAVRGFAALPEATSLAAANKRVGNILKKADGTVAANVNGALLKEPAEAALAHALHEIAPHADAAFERGDYTASLRSLAALKAPVDAFFDSVMVNAEDPALRANRLGLLARLHKAMNRVADLSKLAS